MILDRINKPNDLHDIPLTDFPALAGEIRELLIRTVSTNGGHLASNLGAVELTLALHNVLTFPEDKIIWDVGHQCYVHKILTGRKEEFSTLRTEGGLSGFPKRQESPCDVFDTGHSSNSISAGLGYVRARDLLKENYHVVAVIGDGSMTGGMAYEAMNNAALLKTNFIIVLNDNNMSISKNVGGMSTYLSALRTAQAYTGMKMSVTKALNRIPAAGEAIVQSVRRTKSSIKQLFIPGMLFENIGLTYLGPVDGHNMRQMMRLFNEAKKVKGPVIVHVLTEKGRGYLPARKEPDRFHGTGPFDIATGEPVGEKKSRTYTDVFSDTMTALGRENDKIAAVTAAMPSGTGLQSFAEAYPDRFFDVGIAEEHAVTFAAGLALGGIIPVTAVYSSFLQRAVDQMLQDVCMQNLHVIFAVDRAGLVGQDGETHQGCFDLSYLTMMPNMTVMAPSDASELQEMLKYAVSAEGPCAIRYPRGDVPPEGGEEHPPLRRGQSEIVTEGETLAILAVGSMNSPCTEACRMLRVKGIDPTLVNVRFVKPVDTVLLDRLAGNHSLFVTVEENTLLGGYGEQVCAYMEKEHPEVRVISMGIPDRFIPHGNTKDLLREVGLDAETIARRAEEELG